MMATSHMSGFAVDVPIIYLREGRRLDGGIRNALWLFAASVFLLALSPTISEPLDQSQWGEWCAGCCGLFGLFALIAGAKNHLTSDERKMRIGILSVVMVLVLLVSIPLQYGASDEFPAIMAVPFCCFLWLIFGTFAAGSDTESDDERRSMVMKSFGAFILITAIVIGSDAVLFGMDSLDGGTRFYCDNGEDIPSRYVNDGDDDCGDWSDENTDEEFYGYADASMMAVSIVIVLCGSSCFLIVTILGLWTQSGRSLIGGMSTEGTFKRAREHETAGRMYDAAILYQRAEAWSDAGRIYQQLGQTDKADAAFAKASGHPINALITPTAGMPSQTHPGQSMAPSVVGQMQQQTPVQQPSTVPQPSVVTHPSMLTHPDPSTIAQQPSVVTPTQASPPPSMIGSQVSHVSQISQISQVSPLGGVAAGASPQPQAMQGADSIANRFSRQELLATGGMAKVHIALDNTTGDRVVWKEAHDQYNPLQVSNSKLAEEAGLLQKAPHHRMPQFIDHGQFTGADGNPVGVLIIDYIEGGDLKNTVEQVTKMDMRLPTEKVIELVRAVCEPLEFLAALPVPIYHRDLKPQNLIVHPTRGPVLIDFGLAKEVATGQDMSVTRGGSGTWTPPERDAGISGPFTDVYSLGKILYFLCTSEQPPAIMMHDDVTAITTSGHPQWLADLCLRAVWPKHDKRIQTVQSFRLQLENEGRTPGTAPATGSSSDDYTTWS